MAEVVGVVVGVVSLGVQLAESLQKVKRLYSIVKNAPERLADIIDEIESLSDILTELEGEPTPGDANTCLKTQRCVAACRKAVDRFSTYASSLESLVKRCKGRGSVKFAMKAESIEGVISNLESSKSNLVLAYMLYREAMADKRARLVQEQMEIIASGQALLLLQQKQTPQETRISTNKRGETQPRHRGDRRIQPHIRTPAWLSRTIWEIAVDRAISGWTFSLRCYSIVDINSPISIACSEGDVACVRRLLECRDASPFDEIDFFGAKLSLLEASCLYNEMEVARLLIRWCGNTSLKAAQSGPTAPGLLGRFNPSNNISARREHFRSIAENSDMDLEDAEEADRLRILAFIYGTTEEANSVFFWDALEWTEYNAGEVSHLLDAVYIDNEIMYLLDHGYPRYPDKVKFLARSWVGSVVNGRRQSARNAHVLEKLLVGLLDLKQDINDTMPDITPLMFLLHDNTQGLAKFTPFSLHGMEVPLQELEARLQAWLYLLKREGVDLLSYGREEWRFFQCLRSTLGETTYWHGGDRHATLFGFAYGVEPSDWQLWVSHPGDEYAGQFWEAVEQRSLLQDDFSGSHHVPGGWVEGD